MANTASKAAAAIMLLAAAAAVTAPLVGQQLTMAVAPKSTGFRNISRSYVDDDAMTKVGDPLAYICSRNCTCDMETARCLLNCSVNCCGHNNGSGCIEPAKNSSTEDWVVKDELRK